METKKNLLIRILRDTMHKDDNKIKGLEDHLRHKRRSSRK